MARQNLPWLLERLLCLQTANLSFWSAATASTAINVCVGSQPLQLIRPDLIHIDL